MADFVPELVCMGTDLIICGGLYIGLRHANNLIRDLATSPQISIDEDLQQRIQSHPSCIVDGDANTKTLPYAIISGDVAPMGKALSSNYANDMIGVIQKVAFTEHKRKLGKTARWVDSEHTIAKYTNESPFCLNNPQNSQYFVFEEPWRSQLEVWAKNSSPTWDSITSLKRPHVQVLNWGSAARIDLDTVFDQFEPAGIGKFGKHILGSVVGDIHKGVQTTETMLTKGTTLTGIGELVSGPDGIALQPPSDGRPYYLVKQSLNSFFKDMEYNRSAVKICLNIFIGIGVIISGAALWKLYKKLKTKEDTKDQLDNIRTERSNRPAREEGDNVPQNVQCVVCLGAEREVILLDCGHVCVCADCAGELIRASHSCPVCRAVIVRVMPAYVS